MAYDSDLNFIFNNPTRIVFGVNSINELGGEIDRLRCSKAFLITDKGVVDAGLAARVEKALGSKRVGTFDKCVQDSDLRIINEAAGIAKSKGADILVSLGGGSVIDTTKGAAIVLKEGGKIDDIAGYQMLSQPQTPHIVIPTTNSGSEVTNAAVVKDWENHRKLEIVDDNIYANAAILDPTLMTGLPSAFTATTGMDALCHAIEAIHNIQCQPMADAWALRAIPLIMEHLPRCVEDGKDLFARGQQLLASTMAGIAFTNSQVAMVHAIAHMLGGLFRVPHGLANSIMLPHVIRFNADACGDRYAIIANAMGLDMKEINDENAGMALADAVTALSKKMGIPQRLRDAGVPEEDLVHASEVAMTQAPMVVNPRPVNDETEVLEVLRQAW